MRCNKWPLANLVMRSTPCCCRASRHLFEVCRYSEMTPGQAGKKRWRGHFTIVLQIKTFIRYRRAIHREGSAMSKSVQVVDFNMYPITASGYSSAGRGLAWHARGHEGLGFWILPTSNQSTPGLDGAQWILEGVNVGKYHVVNRWSPKDGQSRQLMLDLVALSGITVESVYCNAPCLGVGANAPNEMVKMTSHPAQYRWP